MKPLIKWSGGKRDEIKEFIHLFPQNYNNYVEPFLGGGSVFFYLEKENSIVNDINKELISFYNLINSEKNTLFFCYLNYLHIQRIIFKNYIKTKNKNEIEEILTSKKFININLSNLSSFITKEEENTLLEIINKGLRDKIKRINTIEKKNDIIFNNEQLKNHLETILQSSLYYLMRDIYNKNNSEICKYIASWYFVKEFSYSGMIRFSKSGNFNVPYGGIDYNKKDFNIKVNELNNKKIFRLFDKTEFNNLDFEDLFKKYNYFNENDFIFLDPPYDSEFSQYNKEQDFDLNEQIRLKNELMKVNCKFIMVIKETAFIANLYSDSCFNIIKFDKQYKTNMRNRNNKEVVHLIIKNY